LDVDLQIIEHEHGPIQENIIARNVKTMKCNYALYLLNRARRTWRTNSIVLSRGDCDWIREKQCPTCGNYERCKKEELGGRFWTDDALLTEFLKGQRIFDLREEALSL